MTEFYFRSPRAKALLHTGIAGGRRYAAQFVDGEFTTDDDALAARLRRLGALGVIEVNGPTVTVVPPTPPTAGPAGAAGEGAAGSAGDGEGQAQSGEELTPPAGNASREDWAAFAVRLGIDVSDDQKRDDIKAIVETLLADREDDGAEQ